MIDLEQAVKFIKNKPFILYTIEDDDFESFFNNKENKGRFSFSIKNSISKNFTKNSIVLIFYGNEVYLSLLASKDSITSVEKRVILSDFYKLTISLENILSALDGKQQEIVNEKLFYQISNLTPKISEKILTLLWEEYKEVFNNILLNRKIVRSDTRILQFDAIKLAMSTAEIDRSFNIEEVVLSSKEDSEISSIPQVKLLEDNQIVYELNEERDCLEKVPYRTGKIVFKNSLEKLTIYTANKLPLEQVFGVDLIYVNEVHKNIVMVQYKMMDKESNKWVFRFKNQFYQELKRMEKVSKLFSNQISSEDDDYRLNSSPFFLRFIRNIQEGDKIYSFNIALEHFNSIENLSICRGSRGGPRLDYEMMNKHFIGKQELEGLIRSGYIGTHIEDSNKLSEIIDLVSQNDMKHSLVLAYKEKLSQVM